jgi:microcystin-dependent protein
MGVPYVGEIILVGFNFAPVGWALCDGQLLPISENETLFQLIGTTYGGDGQTTFALPDLRGRVPIGTGQGPGLQNRILGEAAGTEAIALTVQHIPPHSHPVDTSALAVNLKCKNGPGNQRTPVGNVPAIEAAGATMPYSSAATNATMAAAPVSITGMAEAGGIQSHDNMQPYVALNYCISLFGVFPSQT